MEGTRFILGLALVFLLGCGKGTSDPTRITEQGGKNENISTDDQAKDARLIARVDRIEKKVEKAIIERDFVAANQNIRKGLNRLGEVNALAEERAKFLMLSGIVARDTGMEIEARRHFDDAMAIFHVHRNIAGKLETTLAIGKLETQRGDYAAAKRQYSAAKELLSQVKDRRLKGLYLVHTAHLASRQVSHQEARDGYMEAIQVFEEIQDKRRVAENLLALASEEDALLRSAACLRHLKRARGIFEELEHLDGQVRAVHRMAGMAERDKKYKKARQLLLTAAELYDKLDQTTAATKVRQHLNALPDPQ